MQISKFYFLAKSPILRIFLVLLLSLSTVILLKVLLHDYYPDFSAYYYATMDAFRGENPYLGKQNYFAPFIYPPSDLLFFFPLTFFSFAVAQKIFTVFSLACLVVSLVLLLKMIQVKPLSNLGLFIMILVFNFFPAKFTLGMGQINHVILLLIVLFLYFLIKKRETLSGIFLAFAIAIKLVPLLVVLYLLIKKQWKILVAYSITLVAIACFVILLLAPEINGYFFTNVLPGLFNAPKGEYYNQSLGGFLIRTVGNESLQYVLRVGIGGGLVLIALFSIWKLRKWNHDSILLSISLLLTVSLIVNTFSWQHHFVWILPSLFIVFYFIRKKHLAKKYYLLLALSYLLIAINLKNPSSIPIIFQSHVLYGAILLYLLNIYLLSFLYKIKSLNLISWNNCFIKTI